MFPFHKLNLYDPEDLNSIVLLSDLIFMLHLVMNEAEMYSLILSLNTLGFSLQLRDNKTECQQHIISYIKECHVIFPQDKKLKRFGFSIFPLLSAQWLHFHKISIPNL